LSNGHFIPFATTTLSEQTADTANGTPPFVVIGQVFVDPAEAGHAQESAMGNQFKGRKLLVVGGTSVSTAA
jgi:hypothetical protein